MGHLQKGRWAESAFPTDKSGNFTREPTKFRDKILSQPEARFKPEANRYHLYVSFACPWAHRTLIMRKLKGLEDVISISVVDPHMGKTGWHFSEAEGCIPDSLFGAKNLFEIYLKADPDATTRVTVPVLWDKQENTIVNNESREIMRMLDTQFEALATTQQKFYFSEIEQKIESCIDEIYEPINNGVYRCGFAQNQESYERAMGELFPKLEELELRLSHQPYLCGSKLTEADWCLFTTLIRFDLVYFLHYKCNLKRIQDFPNLWHYLRHLFRIPGVAETCHFDHIKTHYYWSHESVNPHRIIPVGPKAPWWEQMGRLEPYQGRYLKIIEEDGWEYVERAASDGAVVMVPVSKEGKLILVEQYRVPLQRKVLEFPAGLINDQKSQIKETWQEAASRELMEETGYQATEWEQLTVGPPSPGLSNEQVILALSTGVLKKGPGGGVEGEQIKVIEVDMAKIRNFLADYVVSGGIVDPKIYAGLYFLQASKELGKL